jgi:predicted dehydrogenase
MTNDNAPKARRSRKRKVRYAVVGLGHIAQVAVLPAFANAKKNSVFAALVSSDHAKLTELGEQYQVEKTYTYEQYDECLKSGEVDAVYIALPNHMHCEYAVRAAEAGVHVLCEKPMAVTEDECQKMIHAAETAGIRLMIAYRLHFEAANLRAIEIVKSGQLGDVRLFISTFSVPVKDDNIRLDADKGGGTLYDIGVYCINAARYLFRDEPIEVFAFSANSGEPRFSEIDEMTSAILRFPNERLASFATSFGASAVDSYRICGTEGDLRVEPAYDYKLKLTHYLTLNDEPKKQAFAKRDHFAAQLLYFSDCVLNGIEPEPSGWEGLADVRIVEALYRSAATGQPVKVEPVRRERRPTIAQEIHQPPVNPPEPVHASSPTE